MLHFDRRSRAQGEAARRLPVAALLAAASYPLLDRLLTSLFGGVWGVLGTLLLLGVPLGALWWTGETGTSGLKAVVAGGVLAVATALVYTWLFAGTLA